MTNDVNFNIASKIIIYTILTINIYIYIWQLTNYANLILLNYIMIFLINFDVCSHSNFKYIILFSK
jgi:hypothetical protein